MVGMGKCDAYDVHAVREAPAGVSALVRQCPLLLWYLMCFEPSLEFASWYLIVCGHASVILWKLYRGFNMGT